MQTVFFSKTL